MDKYIFNSEYLKQLIYNKADIQKKKKKEIRASICEKAGISRGTLSHYENGRAEPDISTIIFFSEYFGWDDIKTFFMKIN